MINTKDNDTLPLIRSFGELQVVLASRADDDYRAFIMKGIPSERPFLGVRIPEVRTIVKRITKERIGGLLLVEPVAFEEVIARGILIANLPYERMLEFFDSQIAYIDDWCACDTFCSEVSKNLKSKKTDFLTKKIEPLLASEQEFAVRAGLVLLKCSYINLDYLHLIFDRVETLAEREEYYIKMAIAWLMAECFIKMTEPTLGYLKVSKLPKWTFNKTISKICDSYRVETDVKTYLKTLKR